MAEAVRENRTEQIGDRWDLRGIHRTDGAVRLSILNSREAAPPNSGSVGNGGSASGGGGGSGGRDRGNGGGKDRGPNDRESRGGEENGKFKKPAHALNWDPVLLTPNSAVAAIQGMQEDSGARLYYLPRGKTSVVRIPVESFLESMASGGNISLYRNDRDFQEGGQLRAAHYLTVSPELGRRLDRLLLRAESLEKNGETQLSQLESVPDLDEIHRGENSEERRTIADAMRARSLEAAKAIEGSIKPPDRDQNVRRRVVNPNAFEDSPKEIRRLAALILHVRDNRLELARAVLEARKTLLDGPIYRPEILDVSLDANGTAIRIIVDEPTVLRRYSSRDHYAGVLKNSLRFAGVKSPVSIRFDVFHIEPLRKPNTHGYPFEGPNAVPYEARATKGRGDGFILAQKPR